MTTRTTDWASRMKALDARLRPIAEGPPPVDISDPDWARKMRAATPAVDQAGVRDECEALLSELVSAYEDGDDDARSVIRQLFHDYRSFAWAVSLPVDGSTSAGLKAHLVHYSILDQRPDPRDAQMWLNEIMEAAREAGTPTQQALEEVAELSSPRPVFDGWRSTREQLLNAR